MLALSCALSIFWIPVAIAKKYRWGAKGWVRGWLILFLFAGSSRISLWLAPQYAPIFSRIFLGVLVLVTAKISRISFPSKISIENFIWGLLSAFVFLRNFHPQYDVDSLSYHFPSLLWLFNRPHLSPIQGMIQNQNFAYRLIGLEEFLAIPCLDNNLPFLAGLIGGVLKLLSLYSVIAIIPSSFSLGKYLAAFFLLIDDHFFFSGQSRFVYLNPSMIGLVALSLWLSWRGARGSPKSAWSSLVLALCLPAAKGHGLFFAFGVIVVFCFGIFVNAQISAVFKSEFRKSSTWLWLLCPMAALFSVYGLNWIETGSPIYPLKFGPFVPRHYSNILNFVNKGVPPGSFLQDIRSPLKTTISSGNLSMKLAALLWLPSFAIWASCRLNANRQLASWIRKNWKISFSERNASFALFGFSATMLWAALAEAMVHGESRYPRYIFGLTTAAVVISLRSIRLHSNYFRRLLIKIPSFSVGLIALILLVIGIDRRYYNIPLSKRTNWKQIVLAIQNPFYRALNPNSQEVLLLVDEYWRKNVVMLVDCLQKVSDKDFRLKDFTDGNGLLLFSPGMGWPNYLVARYAARGDAYAFFSLPEGVNSLEEAGIQYALFPSLWRKDVPEEIKQSEMLSEIIRQTVPLSSVCGSDDMELVQLKQ